MISFYDDLIDLRDFPEYVDDVIEDFEHADEADTDDEPGSPEFEAEYAESPELQAVLELAGDILHSGDFGGDARAAALALSVHGDNYGPTLISDGYFEDYARQLADDLGCIPNDEYSWPICHIDWEAAAESLKNDYASVTFGGNEFFIQNY